MRFGGYCYSPFPVGEWVGNPKCPDSLAFLWFALGEQPRDVPGSLLRQGRWILMVPDLGLVDENQCLDTCLPSTFFVFELVSLLVQTLFFCACRVREQCCLILVLNWQKCHTLSWCPPPFPRPSVASAVDGFSCHWKVEGSNCTSSAGCIAYTS